MISNLLPERKIPPTMKQIRVTVTPNSKKPSVSKVDETLYEVRVDEKAHEGRANSRLVEILSEYFRVRKSSILIIRGAKSREKIVLIRND